MQLLFDARTCCFFNQLRHFPLKNSPQPAKTRRNWSNPTVFYVTYAQFSCSFCWCVPKPVVFCIELALTSAPQTRFRWMSRIAGNAALSSFPKYENEISGCACFAFSWRDASFSHRSRTELFSRSVPWAVSSLQLEMVEKDSKGTGTVSACFSSLLVPYDFESDGGPSSFLSLVAPSAGQF